MRFEVTVQAVQDDGVAYWGYMHSEVFVPTDDAQRNDALLASAILERVDEARDTISQQAQTDLRAQPHGE